MLIDSSETDLLGGKICRQALRIANAFSFLWPLTPKHYGHLEGIATKKGTLNTVFVSCTALCLGPCEQDIFRYVLFHPLCSSLRIKLGKSEYHGDKLTRMVSGVLRTED